MKIFSSYLKELKIAARGFYFYVELAVAVILLLILLVGIKEDSVTKAKEFLYNEIPTELYDILLQKNIDEGRTEVLDPTEWILEPAEFTLTNRDTGEITNYSFPQEKSVLATTSYKKDPETGVIGGTVYSLDSFEDMVRLSYQEKAIGAFTKYENDGTFSYQYINQGYETSRYIDTLYILHNEDFEVLDKQKDLQKIRTIGSIEVLSKKGNILPAFLTFAGSLMGFFIVVAYIFLDKGEGVIKAFAVTPTNIYTYLISKIMIICTTVVISSSIIVIPIMGQGPDYLMLYLFIIVSTAAFSAMGLLVASYFDSMNKAFGTLYGLMIVLMIPAFSYYIPSFDPLWLRFFPTYPALQVYKDLLLGVSDTGYAWIFIGVYAVSGIILLIISNIRFKKTLTV